jgi:hypothetical protein
MWKHMSHPLLDSLASATRLWMKDLHDDKGQRRDQQDETAQDRAISDPYVVQA